MEQNSRNTNYFGNKEGGKYLREIMYPGASADWRQLLKGKTGEDLSVRAKVDYFQPLTLWLKNKNEGRVHTLPEMQ